MFPATLQYRSYTHTTKLSIYTLKCVDIGKEFLCCVGEINYKESVEK